MVFRALQVSDLKALVMLRGLKTLMKKVGKPLPPIAVFLQTMPLGLFGTVGLGVFGARHTDVVLVPVQDEALYERLMRDEKTRKAKAKRSEGKEQYLKYTSFGSGFRFTEFENYSSPAIAFAFDPGGVRGTILGNVDPQNVTAKADDGIKELFSDHKSPLMHTFGRKRVRYFGIIPGNRGVQLNDQRELRQYFMPYFANLICKGPPDPEDMIARNCDWSPDINEQMKQNEAIENNFPLGGYDTVSRNCNHFAGFLVRSLLPTITGEIFPKSFKYILSTFGQQVSKAEKQAKEVFVGPEANAPLEKRSE